MRGEWKASYRLNVLDVANGDKLADARLWVRLVTVCLAVRGVEVPVGLRAGLLNGNQQPREALKLRLLGDDGIQQCSVVAGDSLGTALLVPCTSAIVNARGCTSVWMSICWDWCVTTNPRSDLRTSPCFELPGSTGRLWTG